MKLIGFQMLKWISGSLPRPFDSSAVPVGARDSPATIKNKKPQKTKFFLWENFYPKMQKCSFIF